MDISSVVDKLNTSENLDTEITEENFASNFNTSFDDDYVWDTTLNKYVPANSSKINTSSSDNANIYKDIEINTDETSLTTLKERRLFAVQTMFKKSIKVSIKSFLISLSLSFLNLFI